jgi:gentisate 1,2-dioxygenase
MGAPLGEDTVHAEVGDLVFKPRGQWHTFWNPGDQPCRILEVISSGGFEHFFDELAAKMASPDFAPPQLGELGARYGLEFDPESIARLCIEHSLTHALLEEGRG